MLETFPDLLKLFYRQMDQGVKLMDKGIRFTGGIPSLWFLVRFRRASIRGQSDSCHESNLNTAGPRAFMTNLAHVHDNETVPW